jgi:hypothetical protein
MNSTVQTATSVTLSALLFSATARFVYCFWRAERNPINAKAARAFGKPSGFSFNWPQRGFRLSFPAPNELSPEGIRWRAKGYRALAVAGLAFVGLWMLLIYVS